MQVGHCHILHKWGGNWKLVCALGSARQAGWCAMLGQNMPAHRGPDWLQPTPSAALEPRPCSLPAHRQRDERGVCLPIAVAAAAKVAEQG